MKTAKLLDKVVFMPPVNEIIGSLEDNIVIACRGQQVVILDRESADIDAFYVMYKNFTKWIPEYCVELA